MTAALTWDDLLRYHREIFLPDFERILDSRINAFRDDLRAHFERIYARMDRMIEEQAAFNAALAKKNHFHVE